jgi:cytochrome bd-type quinol oxidase subunit 1
MQITVIILAFFLGGLVSKSMQNMSPEKMESIEKNFNEKIK